MKFSKLRTVYFGGGTPTTLTDVQLDKLISKVKNSFDFTYNGKDITGVPMAKLSDGNFVFLVDGKMKKICINLISI